MTPAMSMKTPLMSERILKDAQDALAFMNATTPLVGGQNAQLNSKTNTQNVADTPNLGQKRHPKEDESNKKR